MSLNFIEDQPSLQSLIDKAQISPRNESLHPNFILPNQRAQSESSLNSQISENESCTQLATSVQSNDLSSESEYEEQLQEQNLEQAIMKEIVQSEKKVPYREEVTEELIRRYELTRVSKKNLTQTKNFRLEKTAEFEVSERIEELILARLLSNLYGKSELRLVLAHYHLGKAYLKVDSMDMAIEHLSLAIHINEKMSQKSSKSAMLQPYMLNVKADALMLKKNFTEAMGILKENISEKISTKYPSDCKNKAMTLLAKCESKLGFFDKALETINSVIKEIKDHQLPPYALAFTLVEKGVILAADQRHNEAIQAQETAIKTLIQVNYSRPLEVVRMYEVLSDYFVLSGNPQNCLFTMQKVRTLYQEIYSDEDKQVIRTRRKIAVSLLKSQRYKEAVNQLLDIVEIEEKVFGESSLPVARSLKLLGIVYRSLETNNARVYLTRAMKIFNKNGLHKQVAEIKATLSVLNSYNNGRTMDIFPHSQQEI